MTRAKGHYIPGHVWHVTHRCHKELGIYQRINEHGRNGIMFQIKSGTSHKDVTSESFCWNSNNIAIVGCWSASIAVFGVHRFEYGSCRSCQPPFIHWIAPGRWTPSPIRVETGCIKNIFLSTILSPGRHRIPKLVSGIDLTKIYIRGSISNTG